ncbi:MAG: hypothetical protein J6D28_06555 [Bacilli bacterium]|nr:hypothetical protein [Bacilli bacterium]
MNEEKNNINQDEILDATSIFNQPENAPTVNNQAENINIESNGNINNVPLQQVNNPNVMQPNMGMNTTNTQVNNPNVMQPNMGMNTTNTQVNNPNVMQPNMGMNTTNTQVNNPNVMQPNMRMEAPNTQVNNPNVMQPNMRMDTPNTQVNNPNVMQPNMGMNTTNTQVNNSNVMQPNIGNNAGISMNNQPQGTPNINNDSGKTNTQMMNMQPLLEPISQAETTSVLNQPKPKKKKSKLPILIVIILLLTGIIVGGIFYLKSINVYEKFIDNSFKLLYNKFDSDISTTTMTLKANINVPNVDPETQKMLDMINKISISTKSQIDIKNNITSQDINATYNGKELLSLNVYTNENAYIYLNNIYDKYIQVPLEEQLINYNDEKTIIMSIKNALNKSIKDDYINKKMDGNKWKNTLVINNSNSKDMIKTFIKTLLEDEEFIKVLEKIDSETVSELKQINLDEITGLNQDEEITINIYTSIMTNEFINADLIYNISGEQSKIIIDKDNNVYNISITSGEEKIDFIIKKAYDNTTIECNYQGATIKIEITSNTIDSANIEPKDISNNIQYEQLTDQDINTIQNNLIQNEGINEIMTTIESYIEYLTGNISNKLEQYDTEYNDALYDNL